jgi:hypothetical protein
MTKELPVRRGYMPRFPTNEPFVRPESYPKDPLLP